MFSRKPLFSPILSRLLWFLLGNIIRHYFIIIFCWNNRKIIIRKLIYTCFKKVLARVLNIQLVFLPLEERKCWIFLPNTLILWIRHLPANSAMAVLVKVEEESSGEGNWDRKASCNYSPQIVQTNIQIHRLCLIFKKNLQIWSHISNIKTNGRCKSRVATLQFCLWCIKSLS